MAGALVPEDDLYARLEIAVDASPEAIELAWRALLKQHHPDVAGDDAVALERAKRINVAHDWLSDQSLRARYDRERLGLAAFPAGRARTGVRHGRPPRAWPPQPARRTAPARARRSTRPDLVRGDPAERLARFLDRVTRLSADELDRLAAAEPPPIAFLATIRRFLTPDAAAAFADVELAVAARVPPERWSSIGLREGLLGVAAELVLSPFLDDTLADPFRGRARDRLLRAWEASIDQPRYGPNGAEVLAIAGRVRSVTAAEVAAFIHASAGIPGDDRPWPPAARSRRGRGAADLRAARVTRRRAALPHGRPRAGHREPGSPPPGANGTCRRPAARVPGRDLRAAGRAVHGGDRRRADETRGGVARRPPGSLAPHSLDTFACSRSRAVGDRGPGGAHARSEDVEPQMRAGRRGRPAALSATSMNGRSRADVSVAVRRNAASFSSSVPSTSEGSSRPQCSVFADPGKTGHVARARSQTVMT